VEKLAGGPTGPLRRMVPGVKRSVLLAAAVLVAASHGGASAQARSGGSQVPCAVPLAWRLARVDAEFGISEAETMAALREAAALWEERVGRALFRYDPEDGFPIRLVYDDRQARTDERGRREGELAAERARLDVEGEALKGLGDVHAAARARYAARQDELQRRVTEHNAEVRSWNERGGAPEDVADRLDSTSDELLVERQALEVERRSLEEDLAELQREVDRLNRANADHARRAEALAREFPSGTMEAGEYREAARMQNGRVATVGREIRVYRFASGEELRLIVAHELGHALGLGHIDEPKAVMSAAHDVRTEGSVVTSVHPADLELLLATCPAFRSGSGR